MIGFSQLNAPNIKAIDSKYREYYPASVLNKRAPTPSIDIYMAAITMIKLLGGDPNTKIVPDSVPKSIRNLLRVCTMDPSGLDVALEVHEEFKQILEKLYGLPKFRDFSLTK